MISFLDNFYVKINVLLHFLIILLALYVNFNYYSYFNKSDCRNNLCSLKNNFL
jgi:hypothetical protein